MRQSILFLLCLFAFEKLSSQGPTPRASGHLFYYKPTKSLLLLDGYEPGIQTASGKSELWQWRDKKWLLINSDDQPLRSLSAASYINDGDRIFVFGGIGRRGYDDSLRDAFLYDGIRWKGIADKSIGTRDHHEMAYDVANKTIVVYGGQTGNREFDTKTWIFKGGEWMTLDISGPGPRVHHAMAYDVVRRRIVLYGGSDNKQSLDETWEFDGNNWTRIQTTINPGTRTHHSMVYDPVSKRVLLYGGGEQGDIWAWNGKAWEKLSENGPRRILAAVAFDPDKNKLCVFGGNGGENFLFVYSDLWEWDGKKWERIYKGDTYKFDMKKSMFLKVAE